MCKNVIFWHSPPIECEGLKVRTELNRARFLPSGISLPISTRTHKAEWERLRITKAESYPTERQVRLRVVAHGENHATCNNRMPVALLGETQRPHWLGNPPTLREHLRWRSCATWKVLREPPQCSGLPQRSGLPQCNGSPRPQYLTKPTSGSISPSLWDSVYPTVLSPLWWRINRCIYISIFCRNICLGITPLCANGLPLDI